MNDSKFKGGVKLAFEGKITRGLKFKSGVKLSKNVRKLGRKLRQKQFKQGCELDRFHELMTHYNIEPTKENYREMSQLLTIDSDKIFHRDRTNAPHTTEAEESFVHGRL